MIQSYVSSYGLRATIFRPNFIVGPIPLPRPYTDNLIYDFIEALQNSGVIELAGDGSYQREWLHPRDVAAAISLAVPSSETGCETYILSGHRVTMRELADRVIHCVGKGSTITIPVSVASPSSHPTKKRAVSWDGDPRWTWIRS